MPRSEFRFEKILTFRSHQEKQKQRELAMVVQLEQKQNGKITAIDRQRRSAQQEQKSQLMGVIRPSRLSGYSRYYLKLKRDEVSGREILKQIGEEVAKRREALIEATRKKKIYEKLKERHLEKVRLEQNRAMQKENDETGQQYYWRNQ